MDQYFNEKSFTNNSTTNKKKQTILIHEHNAKGAKTKHRAKKH